MTKSSIFDQQFDILSKVRVLTEIVHTPDLSNVSFGPKIRVSYFEQKQAKIKNCQKIKVANPALRSSDIFRFSRCMLNSIKVGEYSQIRFVN